MARSSACQCAASVTAVVLAALLPALHAASQPLPQGSPRAPLAISTHRQLRQSAAATAESASAGQPLLSSGDKSADNANMQTARGTAADRSVSGTGRDGSGQLTAAAATSADSAVDANDSAAADGSGADADADGVSRSAPDEDYQQQACRALAGTTFDQLDARLKLVVFSHFDVCMPEALLSRGLCASDGQVIEDTSRFRPAPPKVASKGPHFAFLGPNVEDAVFEQFQATPTVGHACSSAVTI